LTYKPTVRRRPILKGFRWTSFETFLIFSIIFHIILITIIMLSEKAPTSSTRQYTIKLIKDVDIRALKAQRPPRVIAFEGPPADLRPLSPGSESGGSRKPIPGTPANNAAKTPKRPPPDVGERPARPFPDPEGSPTQPLPGPTENHAPPPRVPGERPLPPRPPGNGDVALGPRHVVVKHPGEGPGMTKAFKLIKQNKYSQAEKVIRESLKRDPKNSHALVALGELHEARGQLKTSLDYYKKAYKLAPRHTHALHKLAPLLLTLDNPDSALDYFKKASEIEEPETLQKDMLAEIYLHRSASRKAKNDPRWKEDVQLAEKTLGAIRKKGHPLVQVSLGKVALLKGKKREAISHFEKVLDSDEIRGGYKIDVLMTLGVLYTELGDRDSAIKYLDQLVAFMDKWTPVNSGRGLFVREYALLYKETVLGADVNPDLIFKHERFYKELYRQKLQRPEVEVRQTLYILSEMVDMVFDEPEEIPLDEINEYMSIAEGPEYPQCFFNKAVNRPSRYMIGFILFGDTYYRNLDKKKALFYYDKALKLSPGNPFILSRIKKARKLK